MEWQDEYPRLFDLFEASEQCDKDNYFSLMSNLTTRIYGAETYRKWEGILSQLDSIAFNCLVQKAKRAVSIRNDARGWEQLFNSLNEAKGYLYLKEKGYQSIVFVKETTESTPDLYAKSDNKSALLEVKTIRKSDVDIPRDRVWQGVDIIPEGLKNKINNDFNKAIEQFNCFGRKVDLSICYFIVSLDLALDMNQSNRDRLAEYIESLAKPGVQLEYEFHSA